MKTGAAAVFLQGCSLRADSVEPELFGAMAVE